MKPGKALEMALDAEALGTAGRAAKKHKVHRVTVEKAKRQVRETPELLLTFTQRKRELAHRLHDLRGRVLEEGAERIRALIAVEGDLHKVAGAYKIIADHHEVALGVMADGQHTGSAGEDSGAQTPPAATGGERQYPLYEYDIPGHA